MEVMRLTHPVAGVPPPLPAADKLLEGLTRGPWLVARVDPESIDPPHDEDRYPAAARSSDP
jgi:hypothetical protein